MSLHEYEQSKVIATKDYPFYAIIMAAMRQADTYNLQLLENAFPGTLRELKERYNMPGGLLPGDDNVN